MMKTGWVLFLTVLAALLLFSACVSIPFETPPTQTAGELTHVPNTGSDEVTEVPLRQWMYFHAFWEGGYFSATPTINAEQVVTAVRNNSSDPDNTWKAQLIRFYPKDKQEYKIKLWIKGNKAATIKAYFGADPYIEELATVKNVEVTTSGKEIILEFGPKNYTGAKFLKFSLEFGHVPDLELQVKVLGEWAK